MPGACLTPSPIMPPTIDRPQDVMRTLGRIEGKLDSVLDENSKIRSTQGAHAERIRALEGSRKYVRGGIAVIGVVITYVLTQLKLPF